MREKIVGGVLPPLGDELTEVGPQVADRLVGHVRLAIRLHGGGQQLVGPASEPGAVLERDAEQLADDGDGHRHGQIAEDVGLGAVARHDVEETVDELLRARSQGLHPPHGQRTAHEPPQAGMIGAVHAGERAALHHARRLAGRVVLPRRSPAEARIGQHDLHVGMARDDPTPAAVRQLHAPYGIGSPPFVERRVVPQLRRSDRRERHRFRPGLRQHAIRHAARLPARERAVGGTP